MKYKITTLILLSLFLISGSVRSQKIDINLCSYGEFSKDAELCKTISWNALSSNIEAEKKIDIIIAPLGLKRNFILVPCNQIKNCAAVTIKETGLRYIVYDLDFLNSIQNTSGNRWTSLSILAHEIGHHLNGHTLINTNKAAQREEELEADEFSGFILFKLGANLNDAQSAINSIQHPTCPEDVNFDHPCKSKRLESIKIGWGKAKSLESNQDNMDFTDETDSSIKLNSDNEKKIFDLYSLSFNEGIKAFELKNWVLSLKYFSAAVKYSDYIFKNKWTSVSGFDTTAVLYAGYSAQNGKIFDKAFKFYARLVNAKINGEHYIDIYRFVLVHCSDNNDAVQFYYLLSIAKDVFQNKNWAEYQLDFVTKNNTLSEKMDLYNKSDAEGKLSELEYLLYGDLFANISDRDKSNMDKSQLEVYYNKAIDAFKQAVIKNRKNGIACFNIGIIYYNKFNEYYNLGDKNLDPIVNVSIEWLEKSFNIFKNNGNRSSNERTSLNKSVALLEKLYEYKKDKRKINYFKKLYDKY